MSTHNPFTQDYDQWWDPKGPFWTLHAINPLRIAYILDFIQSGKALDVGCGGGLLTENLTDFETLGIDTDRSLINIAKKRSNRNYLHASTSDIRDKHPHYFDLITCLEVLEHVKNPQELISDMTEMLKPGGLLFLSTLNRNPISFLSAIVMAEHVLNIIPKNTHHYEDFITPKELIAMAHQSNLKLIDMKGIGYNPLSKTFSFTQNTWINYIACFERK